METPEFKLRCHRTGDAYSLAKNANDYEIFRYLSDDFPHPYTPEHARSWIDYSNSFNPARNMTIEVEGEAAGDIGINIRTGIYRTSAELGYWLGRKYWGKGIMTLAIRKWVPYVFDTFSVYKLYAKVYNHNNASLRVLEKAGLQYEATLKKHIITEGKLRDVHYYSKFRK